MAVTRSQTCLHLIGEPCEEFNGRNLPTVRDVLKVYFHQHKVLAVSQKEAINVVMQKVCEIWNKARVPTAENRNIVRKLENILDHYRNICRNKGRKTVSQHDKESEYEKSIDQLFDIAHCDAVNLMSIEEDKQFLIDQRSFRKYVIGGVDEELASQEERKEARNKKLEAQRQREKKRKEMAESCIGSIDDKFLSCTEDESDGSGSDSDLLQPRQTRGHKRVRSAEAISPAMSAALDRSNVSDRKAAFIISEAAKTYGQDVNKMAI